MQRLTCGQWQTPGETEPASLGLWCWPRERASSGLATGRAPPGPWGGGRRQAPGTLSPTDTAESPGDGGRRRMFKGAEGHKGRNDGGPQRGKTGDGCWIVNIKEPLLCSVSEKHFKKVAEMYLAHSWVSFMFIWMEANRLDRLVVSGVLLLTADSFVT